MKTSTLISLIAGAAVLVAAGLAVVYLGNGDDQPQSEQAAVEAPDAEASGSEPVEGEAASQDRETADDESDAAEASGATGGDSQSGETEASDTQSGDTQASDTQTASQPRDDSNETSAAAPDANAPVAPSFDVVRVEPTGETVLAGRAAPNTKVTILDNGEPIGTVTTDDKGEWVFVPDAPLAPGSRELSLESENAEGLKIPSEDIVVMSVPEPKDSQAASADSADESQEPESEQALAVLQPRDGGTSEVLQAPKGDGIAEGDLVLESVDYGDDGEVTVSGRAKPGSTVRLYLDNELVGEAVPGPGGRWSYRLAERVPYGVYQLRADQVSESGDVLARVETPFSRVEFARAELPDDRFVIVQPGNSLWRIARGTLGAGVQYTVIYEANADQIRDPDLIYPGQIFSVPQTQTN